MYLAGPNPRLQFGRALRGLMVMFCFAMVSCGSATAESDPDHEAANAADDDAATEATQSSTTAAASTSTEAEDLVPPSTQPDVYEAYDDFAGHEFARLAPRPEQLGEGWDSFGVVLLPEAPIFDPSAVSLEDSCGLTEAAIVRNGFYAELGYEGDADDAVVLLSQGNPDQLQRLYDALIVLQECPEQSTDDAVAATRPVPEFPGAVAAYGFSQVTAGQRSDGVLIHRTDFVYLIEVTDEGAVPVDVDALALKLLNAYDGQ